VSARDTSGNVNGDDDREGPADGDCVPVVRCASQAGSQTDIGNNAITQQDEDEGAKHFTDEFFHCPIFHALILLCVD